MQPPSGQVMIGSSNEHARVLEKTCIAIGYPALDQTRFDAGHPPHRPPVSEGLRHLAHAGDRRVDPRGALLPRGTREMNTFILGRATTSLAAFV